MPSAPGCPVARRFVVVKSINRMLVMDKKSGKLILSPSDSSETSTSASTTFSGDSCTLILTRFLGDALRLGVIARFGVPFFFGVAIVRFGEVSTVREADGGGRMIAAGSISLRGVDSSLSVSVRELPFELFFRSILVDVVSDAFGIGEYCCDVCLIGLSSLATIRSGVLIEASLALFLVDLLGDGWTAPFDGDVILGVPGDF